LGREPGLARERTGGLALALAMAIGGIRPHYLICWEKQKAATARAGADPQAEKRYSPAKLSIPARPQWSLFDFRSAPFRKRGSFKITGP
jgi:hypothetical protein